MMNRNRFRFDAHTVFLLATLIGAGSLFVTTLTSDAPEISAKESVAESTPSASIEGTTNAGAAPAPTTPFMKKASACLTDEASIQDFQDLKRQLAKREQELKKREEEITAKEQALSEELKKIDAVRDEIKSAQTTGEARNEEKIAKLVETFETMSPKSAAPIVAGLDERLAVEAMSRVSSAKLGKILAAMEPKKSAPLAEKIAGVVRASSVTRNTASVGAAAATNRVKGGEENGNRKQQNNDAVDSRQPEPAVGK